MADEIIRAHMAQQDAPHFDTAPFVQPPPLANATVAIVTTAGLRKDGDPSWKPNDPGYRLFDRADRAIKLGHLSPNFDRSGFAADLDVVYPIDRLEELAAEGVIGGIAPRHASFMGAQDAEMQAIRSETAPKLARELKRDGVDVVLLTPT